MTNGFIKILFSTNRKEVERVFTRRAQRLDEAERAVLSILKSVRREGDPAVMRYARKWDSFTGSRASELRATSEQIERVARAATPAFRRAVRIAARNLRNFSRLQMPRAWRKSNRAGLHVGQLIRPLEGVGCYIPAGRYPLPSTLLMTAIPAQVAGVPRIVVCTPRLVPETAAVAEALGIEEIYTVGGAHAIAALAYGTKTIAPVQKIVGPGNAYVAAAKRNVSRDTPIDFVAGPTEVLIIAGGSANSEWLASDMLAQAEHDTDAAAILLTTSRTLAERVRRALSTQLQTLDKTSPAARSIRNNGAIVIVRDWREAAELSNRFAPEHLCIPDDFPIDSILNAGSIFVGSYSPEAAGDYASGPNHVLPTSGMARLRGGLSVLDFVKIVSVQQLDRKGLERLAPTIITLARGEGLEAHARSVEIRLKLSATTASDRTAT